MQFSQKVSFANWERASRIVEENTEDYVKPEFCSTPLVSVRVFCYQHAEFIREALDGVFSQQTSFPFEVVIGDDHSTDGTFEILLECQEKYPEQIRLLRSKSNLQGKLKLPIHNILTRLVCKGKYIAVLDGDDFWTDPKKLQRQVDYLEANPGTSGCFTDLVIVDQSGVPMDPRPFWNDPYKESYGQRDCLAELGSSYGTATLVYRSSVWEDGLPDYFLEAGSDFLLDLVITEQGTLDYLPGETASYRIHEGGKWQGSSDVINQLRTHSRWRALEDDPVMKQRYGDLIVEAEDAVFKNMLGLKNRSSFPFVRIKESRFPVTTYTGTFDLREDDSCSLDEWLKSVISDRYSEIVLLLFDRDHADIVWRSGDGGVRVIGRSKDDFRKDENGVDWQLPDFAGEPGLEKLSNRRVLGVLSRATGDFLESTTSGLTTLLEELESSRNELKKTRKELRVCRNRLAVLEQTLYGRMRKGLSRFRKQFSSGGTGQPD